MTAPVIDHVGIIVADLDAAVDKFRCLFPDGPSLVKDMPDVGIRIAKLEAENVTLEFIQYTSAHASFGKQAMGEALGINHVSTRVADADRAIADLRAAGFETKDGFPTRGARGTVAFFEPDDTTGLLFEICQRD